MFGITLSYIRNQVADSPVIYLRGLQIFEHGSYVCAEADVGNGRFVYDIDGNYGDYTTAVQLSENGIETSCDCPYPGVGCKHTVAALLDVCDQINSWKKAIPVVAATEDETVEKYLTEDEIKAQALEDRKLRARQEKFSITSGDTYKGEHLVETAKGRQYVVTLHDPVHDRGHCSCPDYLFNRLGTCKHLYYVLSHVKKKKDFAQQADREMFPFIDIYWDSKTQQPRLFRELPVKETESVRSLLDACFDDKGSYRKPALPDLMPLVFELTNTKQVRIRESVLQRVEAALHQDQLRSFESRDMPALTLIRATLYPYQEEGVKFSLYKEAALIGDEMGLGKTLQAIAAATLKKQVFGFSKVLVVTMASLKEQWKREIERFTDEKATVVAGTRDQRRAVYEGDGSFFKITNYEAVLRDVTFISRFKPDLLILDEAQRIKNFTTKTADAVKMLPRRHALVLTGTPLENKLEDVYSIVQFLDPHMLSPLWKFAADHFMLSRDKKGKVMGYRNLDRLHEKLKSIVIRRRKEEVLKQLPKEVVNNYYVDLHEKQARIHAGMRQALVPILNKKFLTPMDLRRIQELLLGMRRVCDSTYLIDRKTHISPKLKELENILDEVVIQNRRKVVIFSEWTTMTFLIARQLSQTGIAFVELSGKVPVHKRQLLIDEFTSNPDCKVFLSTDAGGTGLNLQAADCVINFELPWNPARLNQRTGRVSRIGQKSGCVNVINLISKRSIEENIYTGIQMKTDVFKGVFDGGMDTVEFSSEKRTEMLNRLREMMGEEEALPPIESRPSEEVPEDTPHYLNPKVLKEQDPPLAYDSEEPETADDPLPAVDARADEAGKPDRPTQSESRPPVQSAEKVEEVFNTGMQFIAGLFEMATGQKVIPAGDQKKMIHIDRATGEVTMKFKLPGHHS